MTAAGGPPLADRQARLAKVYDEEILPAYGARFGALLLARLKALPVKPAARVVEVGCATGEVTLALARLLEDSAYITAVDESSAFLAEARAKLEAADGVRAPVVLQSGSAFDLPVEDAAVDLVVSNPTAAGAGDLGAAAGEIARVLAPGGQVVLTAPLRGTWGEFIDLFREVLRENDKRDSLAALDRYVASLPDGDIVARALETAGLTDVQLDVERWEMLFKSAREFFFSPLVELGPLPRWKQLSGRGDEMQDIFFFTKEAIDTYFKGRVFAVSVVGAAASGRKPG
jgi:ubiquinone/menaquinone biosynthesis C-methylase UbiE